MYQKRVATCFPLKDVVCVLDQDQSGMQRQVTAQNGALKISAFGTPPGTKTKAEEAAVQKPLQSDRVGIFDGAETAPVHVHLLFDERIGRPWLGD